MSIACLIPARGGSKGIPRKNLVDLCGHPLVWWTIEQAKASHVGEVVLLSDDPEILAIGKRANIHTIIEPDDIASDTVSMEDVISYTFTQLTSSYLLVLQPSSPLKLSGHIEQAAVMMLQHPSVVSVVKSTRCLWAPPFALMPMDANGRRMRRQDWPKTFMENGAIYGVTRNKYTGNRFIVPVGFLEMPEWTKYEIDTPEDLGVIRGVLSAILLNGGNGITE